MCRRHLIDFYHVPDEKLRFWIKSSSCINGLCPPTLNRNTFNYTQKDVNGKDTSIQILHIPEIFPSLM